MTLHNWMLIFSVVCFCIAIACQGANLFHRRIYIRELTEKDRRKAMQARIDALAKRYHGH
jgi:hypothetical protein